jgi:hypothetical protein
MFCASIYITECDSPRINILSLRSNRVHRGVESDPLQYFEGRACDWFFLEGA